jgi:glycosyltransferase involved in cell wall biosynthesis
MTRPSKIVHVQLLPLMSGVQKVTLDEFSKLDPSRYERIALCKCEGEFTEKLNKIGVRVHLVPHLERSISPIQDFRAYMALRAFFFKERPDIVHTHSSKTGVLGRFAAFAARVPNIVHTVHGFAFHSESRWAVKIIYKFLERLCGKFTNTLIVLNEFDSSVAHNMLGVPHSRILLLPNGVDIEKYAPTDPDTRQRVRKSVFGVEYHTQAIVGMVGRLWEQKNPHCFVRAAIQVLKTNSDARFFMIGDGELRSELEAVIKAENLSDHIRILGWRTDVPDLLKALDVMVLPSRWEGMPLAILEAMSSAVPVVASDIPGNNHLVSNFIDGRLFPVDDSVSLANALVDLINNFPVRERFSLNARAKIVANFSLSVRVKKIDKIYQSFSS